ncbi:CDGSH iron-sulfur domain-containing protein [Streptomyces sp. SCA2-4]|nr:CDGSH iron-sulfur domain-containing protein [Streptomyces huiliensis]
MGRAPGRDAGRAPGRDAGQTPGPDAGRAPGDGARPEVPPEPPRPARRISREPNGPFLVEGPVEVVMDDGSVVRSDRPVVALCTCRRSEEFPWCDTSHRRRRRPRA